MIRAARKLHRFTSYLLFLQVILWIAGGVTFSLIPFESVIKGGAVISTPSGSGFPQGWMSTSAAQLRALDEISAIASHPSAQGQLLEVSHRGGTSWLRLADGLPAMDPVPELIADYADSIYRGDGRRLAVHRVERPDARVMGLVKELYGVTDVWRVSYDDFPGTRLYFDGPTGRYLTVRNDFWVFYDAMWRLHIMDYGEGEDFNNWFLRLFSVLAAVFAASGAVLSVNGLRRLVSGSTAKWRQQDR